MKINIFLVLFSMVVTGCGTMTGLPSHGGGKRFAYEQTLVNASSREAIKSMPIESIKGKKIALIFSVTGDQGSGNLSGGRLSAAGSFISLLGVYGAANNNASFDNNTATNNASNSASYGFSSFNNGYTSSGAGKSSTTNNSSSANKNTYRQNEGAAGLGIGKEGQAYVQDAFYNNGDAQHLNNLLVSYLLRNGVDLIVPRRGEKPDAYVEILVDVYGTVRDRTDWLITNRERLSAVTSFEYVISPTRSDIAPLSMRIGYEAEYVEDYSFWIGPVERGIKISTYQYNDLLGKFGDPVIQDKSGDNSDKFSKQPPTTVIVPSVK